MWLGKREAEEAIENLASAKKQKKDVVAEQKVETKIQNKSKKEETTDEDTSASESEEEQKVCFLLHFFPNRVLFVTFFLNRMLFYIELLKLICMF